MVAEDAHLHSRWRFVLTRDADGAPHVPPLFVAEQGPAVQIVDVRSREEATGALGYIPGSAFVSEQETEDFARNDTEAPLVLVCADGRKSAAIARRLEGRGANRVAAMAGGIAAWRDVGLSTSRVSTGLRYTIERATSAGSAPLTIERVREHIGDPRSVHWIKVASMVAQGSRSCIDGRDDRAVIGTPGGDGGEFLLLLAAIERVTGRSLDDQAVEQELLAHLDLYGHFYLHTDLLAFDTLTNALRQDPRLQTATAPLSTAEDWSNFLRHTPAELQELVLGHLERPDHIGCGHIRLMLQKEAEYGVRKELVLAFLRAFFRLRWTGSPEIRFAALPGDHSEAAVLQVSLDEEVWGLSRVPLISPNCAGRQMFVNHPDVSTFLRRTTIRALVRGAGSLQVDPSLEKQLVATVETMAARQLAATAAHLARGLPVFNVVFAADGSFEVREQTGD